MLKHVDAEARPTGVVARKSFLIHARLPRSTRLEFAESAGKGSASLGITPPLWAIDADRGDAQFECGGVEYLRHRFGADGGSRPANDVCSSIGPVDLPINGERQPCGSSVPPILRTKVDSEDG